MSESIRETDRERDYKSNMKMGKGCKSRKELSHNSELSTSYFIHCGYSSNFCKVQLSLETFYNGLTSISSLSIVRNHKCLETKGTKYGIWFYQDKKQIPGPHIC